MNDNTQQPQLPTNFFPITPDYGKGPNPVVGIIGHGVIGKAVERSLLPVVQRFLVDPEHNTNIDQLVEQEPILSFVCTPTPSDSSGRIDAGDTVDAVLTLIRNTQSAVVLKSTVSPEVLDKLCRTIYAEEAFARFIYVPEFLTERNADDQYCNPKYMVLGGFEQSCNALLEFFHFNTLMVLPKNQKDDGGIHIVNHIEASLIKYAINTYLATKVTFFNNLFSACEEHADKGVVPSIVAKAVSAEPRIGNTHWRVPGFDGKKGFGGTSFSQDISIFNDFTDKMPLLKAVIDINNNIRSKHEVDQREKPQNTIFGEDIASEEGE